MTHTASPIPQARPFATLVVDLLDPAHPLASELVTLRTAEGLCRLLTQLASADDVSARFEWFASLSSWLHGPPLASALRTEEAQPLNPSRVQFLVRVIELYPTWRLAILGLLSETIAVAPGLELFSEAGLPSETTFLGESATRLARRALPHRSCADLAALVQVLFPGESDARWLESMPASLRTSLAELLVPVLAPALRLELAEALTLLAVRASSLGLSGELRAQRPGGSGESPFVALTVDCAALAEGARQGGAALTTLRVKCGRRIAACLASLQASRAAIEHGSVSLDLVYRLGLGEQLLDRLGQVVDMLARGDGAPDAAFALLAAVVRGQLRIRSLRGLLAVSTRQLGRRIAEYAGRRGEDVLVQTPDQYHRHLTAAAGGGLLTSFTVVMKLVIGWAALPLFFEGLFVSINYAGSFLAMQLCGFSLATKQTSMMAAALARAMRLRRKPHGVVRVVAQVARTHFAGVAGNLGAVIPAAVALDLLCRAVTGHSVLNAEGARHVIESLHPWKSGTVLFAAVTGVLLWLAGVVSGGVENWSRFRRVPEALRARPERRGLLARGFHKLVSHPASSAGSIALGGLMGMVPSVAGFVGLPLQVRHVTLATGGLALAGCAIGPCALLEPSFCWAVGGIGAIALMNFGVAFSLSLVVALRAHGVQGDGSHRLAREVWRALVRAPGEFLLPTATSVVPELHADLEA
jgi:site-specific recombinase